MSAMCHSLCLDHHGPALGHVNCPVLLFVCLSPGYLQLLELNDCLDYVLQVLDFCFNDIVRDWCAHLQEEGILVVQGNLCVVVAVDPWAVDVAVVTEGVGCGQWQQLWFGCKGVSRATNLKCLMRVTWLSDGYH